MTAAAPSGVVTFLFTDIEGSTRRWETDAGAMRAALPAHDEVLRNAIEAHGGYVFSHTGDGFVAFASPTSAANAADRPAVPDAGAAVLFITRQPGKSLAGIASVRRWPR